jgi:hypothetical protein
LALAHPLGSSVWKKTYETENVPHVGLTADKILPRRGDYKKSIMLKMINAGFETIVR